LAELTDLDQATIDLRQDFATLLRVEIDDTTDLAGPVRIPVDCLAIGMELRLGQEAGNRIAQPAPDDATELDGRIVQRFAAYAQRPHTAARGDDKRTLA